MPVATPHHSELVELDSTSINVKTYDGNGPRLLLIHGISSSGSGWDPVIDDLSRHFTPVTMDLRGHGRSGKPETGYRYDDYVDDLEQLFVALDWERPLIMGHSLGGIITLWWAAKHLDRARALVIEDSPLRSGEDFRPAFENWLKLNAMPYDDLVAHNLAEYPDLPREVAESRAWSMTNTKRAVFEEAMAESMANDGVDRIREIEGITSPVLLIHGDIDTGGMVHPDDIAGLSTRLPNARTVRFPSAGHTLHRGETKQAFLDAAVAFLKEYAEG